MVINSIPGITIMDLMKRALLVCAKLAMDLLVPATAKLSLTHVALALGNKIIPV